MAERELPKLEVRVRFPSPAPDSSKLTRLPIFHIFQNYTFPAILHGKCGSNLVEWNLPVYLLIALVSQEESERL